MKRIQRRVLVEIILITFLFAGLLAWRIPVFLRSQKILTEKSVPDPVFWEYLQRMYTWPSKRHLSKPEVAQFEDTFNLGEVSESSKGTYIYDAHISSLRGIEFFTHLKGLRFYSASLHEINLSENRNLRTLILGSNQITTLDLSNLLQLEKLELLPMDLSSIDLSKNTQLKQLRVGKIPNLHALDLSHQTKLERLRLHDLPLQTIDISHQTQLRELYVSNMHFPKIDLSANVQLENLLCNQCDLSELDLSHNLKLQAITCNDNRLTHLDVSTNSSLDLLNASNNRLTDIHFAKSTKVTRLLLKNNRFQKIPDLSALPNLASLDLRDNPLELDPQTIEQMIQRLGAPVYYPNSGSLASGFAYGPTQ